MSNIVIIGSISMDLVMETKRIAKEGETVFGEAFLWFLVVKEPIRLSL